MIVIGEVYNTKYGDVIVIEYNGCKSVLIRFLNTSYECEARAYDVRKGYVKDPLHPSVCGVGFVGCGKFNSKEHRKAYMTWRDMLRRCYDDKLHARQPTYIGCSVDDKWHNFQNFANWFYDNYQPGLHLDKDINGNRKIYSEENCIFVSRYVNSAESHAKRYTLKSPCGEVVDILNMAKFCQGKSLDPSHMIRVFNGKAKSHKGWTK